jgi:hypothetical protein
MRHTEFASGILYQKNSTPKHGHKKVSLVIVSAPCCYLGAMRVAFREWALHPRQDHLRRQAKNCPIALASHRGQPSPKVCLCAGSS